jgi:ferric iron reductase protein FhuF
VIPLLEPLFQGAWAPLGEALVCAARPPAAAVPVHRLIDEPALLDDLLRRHARHLGVIDAQLTGTDLRAAASSWCFAYLDALLPPVVAAASVLQQVFPTGPHEMQVLFDDTEAVPRSFHIGHAGAPQPGTDAATRLAPLVDAHLAPLFAQLARCSRIAPKILWGNLARRLDGIFEQALALTGHAASIALDRDTLLNQPLWHDGRPNPLLPRQRPHPKASRTIPLHRQCCLFYRLPGEDYCSACPLLPQQHLRSG